MLIMLSMLSMFIIKTSNRIDRSNNMKMNNGISVSIMFELLVSCEHAAEDV